MTFKFILHYSLHFIFPLFIAFLFFRKHWLTVYFIFLATMLVDFDHLLASPIYDPERCSINFHPLHGYMAIGFYALGLFFTKTRMVAIGLLMHIVTDSIDCFI